MEMVYLPHDPEKQIIAYHVKHQLDERLKDKNADHDHYFLTAFLDRATSDEEIQLFRENNKNLKKTLIKIRMEKQNVRCIAALLNSYKEAKLNRKSAYDSFLADTENSKNFKTLLEDVDFKRLYDTVPGRFWLGGLMVLFSIVDKIHKWKCDTTICSMIDMFDNNEQFFQKNFQGKENKINGVGDKLALWALTNVNGKSFVIDSQIAKTLNKIGLQGFDGKNKTYGFKKVEKTWSELFGNRENGEWENLNKSAFNKIFVTHHKFKPEDYDFLKFIITQTFWFHGRHRCFA
ncbi:MAG: hypothetical protein HY954_07430 [Deltaproteobacteria bacterium]|nr:hypothetical protein [Deltaproteobacteria bacterium]